MTLLVLNNWVPTFFSVDTYLSTMTASVGDRDQYEANLLSETAGFAGCEIVRRYMYLFLTLFLLNLDMPCLCKRCSYRSVRFWRSGAALFVIQNVNLYQQPGSSNVIGWKRGGRDFLNYSAWQGLIIINGSDRYKTIHMKCSDLFSMKKKKKKKKRSKKI